MKVNLVDISSTEKELEVIIPSEKVKEKHDLIFKQIKASAKVKGFRPGKAPNHVIKSVYGGEIKEEVVSKIISETFEDATKEASVSPINRPNIKTGEIKLNCEFKYSATFEIISEFEISNYKGIELEKRIYEISQEDVDNALNNLRERHAQSKLIEEERVAKEGDFVFVDYKGELEDGTTIDNLQKKNIKFFVGKGELRKEFEDNIVGKKAGEESNFSVKYSEEFFVKEAAGKTVNYALKINEIHERILPELDDNFAKDLGYKNLNELKEKIEKEIENHYQQTTNTNLREQVLDNLVKNNEFDVPKSLVQNEELRLKKEFENSYLSQGIELPPMGKEADEKFTEKAIESLKGVIILNRIAKKDGIEVTKKEVDERIRQIAKSYQTTYENIKDLYEKDDNLIKNLKSTALEKKVLDYIIEKANITEVSASEGSVSENKGKDEVSKDV